MVNEINEKEKEKHHLVAARGQRLCICSVCKQGDDLSTESTVYFVKLRIPMPCPTCEGRMCAVGYLVSSIIPKDASWQFCMECGFYQLAEDFKEKLLTI